MRKAISYGRFSTGEQQIGDSIARQEHAFRTVCERYDLEMTDSLFDRGLSGFHGQHLEGGALGKFLAGVRAGQIEKGTVLVIEQLNRLSRLEPDLAVGLLSDIIRAGIPIAVHTPDMFIDNFKGDKFLPIAMYLQIAHAESQTKSEHQLSVWLGKRQAADGMTKHGLKTRACPSWIIADGADYRFNAQAERLREAIRLAIAGHGQTEIQRRIGRWAGLATILRSRTLVGEYQPMRRTRGDLREPACKAIPGYYPALITEDEWYQLQAALDSRLNHPCKRGKMVTNLFTDLIYDESGNKLVINKRSSGSAVLVPQHRKSPCFHYDVLEKWMLRFVCKLSPSDLEAPNADVSRLASLEGQIGELQAKIEVWTSEALEGSAAIARLIVEAERRVMALMEEREKLLRQRAGHCPLEATQSLISWLDGLEGDELLDARARLKAMMRGIVERIEVRRQGTKRAWIDVMTVGKSLISGHTELLEYSVYRPAERAI